MRHEAMPIGSAKTPDHGAPVARTSSLDAPAARNLLIRRIARLSFLIDQDASDIMIRNERRLVDEALTALIADGDSEAQELGAVWRDDSEVREGPAGSLPFAVIAGRDAPAGRSSCQTG